MGIYVDNTNSIHHSQPTVFIIIRSTVGPTLPFRIQILLSVLYELLSAQTMHRLYLKSNRG